MNTKGKQLDTRGYYSQNNSAFPKITAIVVILLVVLVAVVNIPVETDGFGRSFNVIGQEMTK